jgi:hypothetical protein
MGRLILSARDGLIDRSQEHMWPLKIISLLITTEDGPVRAHLGPERPKKGIPIQTPPGHGIAVLQGYDEEPPL